MSLLVITINDQSMDKKSAEVAFARTAVETAMKEFERGRGTVTSGTILGVSGAGVANTSLGSWTYTPSATNP
jgi:hypothetical protein